MLLDSKDCSANNECAQNLFYNFMQKIPELFDVSILFNMQFSIQQKNANMLNPKSNQILRLINWLFSVFDYFL